MDDRLLESVGGGGLPEDGVLCLVYPLRPYLGVDPWLD